MKAAFIQAQNTLNEHVVEYVNEQMHRILRIPVSPTKTIEIPAVGFMNIPCPRIKTVEVETNYYDKKKKRPCKYKFKITSEDDSGSNPVFGRIQSLLGESVGLVFTHPPPPQLSPL